MKKILNVFSTILVVIVVLLAVLLIGVRLIGLTPYNVLSGSMEPVYHVGSLIYVKDVDPYKLQSGDIITFMLDEETLATHRIVDVIPDEEDPSTIRFQTKGDANDAIDGSLVHYKNVVGTPVFTIPFLGYLTDFIQNPPGKYIAIVFVVLLVMLMFLPDMLDEDKPPKASAPQKASSLMKTSSPAKDSTPKKTSSPMNDSKPTKAGAPQKANSLMKASSPVKSGTTKNNRTPVKAGTTNKASSPVKSGTLEKANSPVKSGTTKNNGTPEKTCVPKTSGAPTKHHRGRRRKRKTLWS